MAELDNSSDEFIESVLAKGYLHQLVSRVGLDIVLSVIGEEIQKIDRAETLVVSLVGGAACGKTTLARKLTEYLAEWREEIISTDDYSLGTRNYRQVKLGEEKPLLKYNFQLLNLIVSQIVALQSHQVLEIPVYNPENGAGVPLHPYVREKKSKSKDDYLSRQIVGPIDLLIVEGDLQPLQSVDYIIYLHLSDDMRLQNRIRRDLSVRNYPDTQAIAESFAVRQTYQHKLFTLPVAEKANILLWAHSDPPCSQLKYCYDIYLRNIAEAEKAG